jgi:hypothetical protein
MKTWVRVNEDGRRIGESHHRAVLTDAEVGQLLADREAGMSLAALARKWRISKSGAKGIVDGSRRGQVGPTVSRSPSQRERVRARPYPWCACRWAHGPAARPDSKRARAWGP